MSQYEITVLAIYGCGGLGREVLELARTINNKESRWSSIVFVIDGEHDGKVNGADVYSYDNARKLLSPATQFVIAVGEPAVRERLFQKVKNDGYSFATLIHPDSYVPETTMVGAGAVIQARVFVSCNGTIGNNVYIQPLVGIGHDCIIGDSSVISSFCSLAGATKVGRESYIGMSSCVREETTIGDYCIIGMASAVHRDVPDGMTAMGNPARVIQRNDDRRVFGKHH